MRFINEEKTIKTQINDAIKQMNDKQRRIRSPLGRKKMK
jgi:hypothetical protein